MVRIDFNIDFEHIFFVIFLILLVLGGFIVFMIPVAMICVIHYFLTVYEFHRVAIFITVPLSMHFLKKWIKNWKDFLTITSIKK